MDLIPAPKNSRDSSKTSFLDSSGIALFMVIASISVLAILVTEFTYIAQISQSIAYGGLDQTQAHYLAKSGLKISLLRLKIYKQIKKTVDGLTKNGGAAASAAVPRGLLEKIWSFPFMYPIPPIPGIGQSQKAAIDKFEKEMNLEGKFKSEITSESSKYNLNMILAPYAPNPSPSASATPDPNSQTASSPRTPVGTSSPPPFDPQIARNSLQDFFNTILTQKFENDPDFASNYRDFRMEDFMDQILGWADRTYERRTSTNRDKIPPKRAPFYSVSELHLLPSLDDELYQLFAPNLTANPIPAINVNTMQGPTLHALVPEMTKEELNEFFKFRDSIEQDNLFQGVEAFFEYLQKNVSAFKGSQSAIDQLKGRLSGRYIQLTIDETYFKITVTAQVGQSVRTIEAWVTLSDSATPSSQSPSTPNQPLQTQQNPLNPVTPGGKPPKPDPGLRITFMRIL